MADLGYGQSASIRLLILCLSFIYSTQAFAQSSFVYEYCGNESGNYTTNSTYKANLDRVLSVFPSRTNNGEGFYSLSSSFYGQPDKIHVTGLCRGDVEADTCHKCLDQSSHLLTQVCPNQKAAIGGFDECFLRYTNISSLGMMSPHPRLNLFNTLKVSSSHVDAFVQNLRALLKDLKDRASLGGDRVKFAMGNTSVSGFDTIHAMVQCTPDKPECKSCLEEAFGDIPEKRAWMGGRVVAPSCNLRYEVYRFDGNSLFNVSLTMSQHSIVVVRSSQSSSYTGATKGKKSNKSRNIFIISSTVVPSVASMVLIISIGVYMRVRKSSNNKKAVENFLPPEASEEIGCAKCLQFDYNTIRDATKNFAAANKISEDDFSEIYKGTLRDEQMITVKCFKGSSSESQELVRNEVLVCSKVRHRNLVRFLGFCHKGDKRFLVFEFLSTSLDSLLFDTENQIRHLNWDKRYKIIKGIARGLLYLHEDCQSTVIHRDIKPSNILLDDDMNPKISGFNLAMVFELDQTEVSTILAGTSKGIIPAEVPQTTIFFRSIIQKLLCHGRSATKGYLAPEYAFNGKISVKADVYSFGVLLLEIVSGHRSSNYVCEHQGSFINYAWKNWSNGTVSNLVDPEITNDITESEQEIIARCLQIGLLCVQQTPDTRPDINYVAHMLSCVSLRLPMPSDVFNAWLDEDLNSGNASPSDDIESPEEVIEEVPTNSTAGSRPEV